MHCVDSTTNLLNLIPMSILDLIYYNLEMRDVQFQ